MRGRVSFEADGETHELRYTSNALCRLEDATGKTIMQLGREIESGGEDGSVIKAIRLMLWGGLPEGTTLDQAGDILDAVGFAQAAELIAEAIGKTFAPATGGAPGKPGKSVAGRSTHPRNGRA